MSLDRTHRGMILELLEERFSDRQVIRVLTHDREWYTELRHQLEQNSKWLFRTLLPYETPETGIRWSHKTTTFSDARALLKGRPDAAANDARRIMDVELPMIAEHLQIRLPYLRSDKNDTRMAHEFLSRLAADGKRRFQKKSAGGYVENTDALDALVKADNLLKTWGNRASHSFDVAQSEASKLKLTHVRVHSEFSGATRVTRPVMSGDLKTKTQRDCNADAAQYVGSTETYRNTLALLLW